MEHAPWLGSWNRFSTALAPNWGCRAVFTNMLRAVPASSLVSLFRTWTHREAKAQLKTPFKPQLHLTAPASSYMGSLSHARHWAVSAGLPWGGEWGNHPGRTALLCSLGQAAPSLPRAVRTFPQAASSSSPKRLCRVSLFPDVLHTRGATSFGNTWKTWRQAWRSRRCHRDDQYSLPLKKQ